MLTALISERDAAIYALEYEVQHLTNELQKQTKVRLVQDRNEGIENVATAMDKKTLGIHAHDQSNPHKTAAFRW